MMRLPMLVALLMLASCALADDGGFNGAWVAWICPEGVARDSGKCSNFVLELHQQGDQLCGAHFFATSGAARIDEGAAPSITGRIADDTATLIAISTRAARPVRVRAAMKKTGGMLHWQRLDNPPGDYLLPLSANLGKAKKRTLFAPLFEQELKAACSSVFAMAAEGAAQQAPR